MHSSENLQPILSPKLLHNCYTGKDVEGEAMVTDHIFSFMISGSHEVWVGIRNIHLRLEIIVFLNATS